MKETVTIYEAIEAAQKHMPDMKVNEATFYDTRESYVFSFTDKNGFDLPGTPFVCIDKQTEEATEMTVPPIENLFVLEAATVIHLK